MKVFYILFLTVIFGLNAQGQVRNPTEPDPVHLKFYPNPATSFINFELNKETDNRAYTVQIYNFMGKKVYESSLTSNKTIVSLTDFTRGIYIFQLKDGNGRVLDSDKFQVNK